MVDFDDGQGITVGQERNTEISELSESPPKMADLSKSQPMTNNCDSGQKQSGLLGVFSKSGNSQIIRKQQIMPCPQEKYLKIKREKGLFLTIRRQYANEIIGLIITVIFKSIPVQGFS